jgi:hypothetical protein
MTSLPNSFRCKICGYSLIAEELETHICKDVVDYRIDYDSNIVWLSDGETWYPRKLLSSSSSPTRNQHDFKHGEDSTEPKIFFITEK